MVTAKVDLREEEEFQGGSPLLTDKMSAESQEFFKETRLRALAHGADAAHH
jgi:hypothetical protein